MNKNRNRSSCWRNALLLLFFVLFFSSCDEAVLYRQYQSIDREGWDKESEYYFVFDVTDTITSYDLTLELRNNNFYPYQNFWVFRKMETPSGILHGDTLESLLADDYGRWLGKGISLFETTLPLENNYQFPETGSYTIRFRQGMRHDKLPGIQDIGLLIAPSAKHPGEEK